MGYLLGVDIGTSGTKTVLFNENCEPVASATREYPLYQPENGWAEQDANDWWDAAAATIAQVIRESGVHKNDIAGIGLSGQMHGLVMLDAHGVPIRKAIIWCDNRTVAECGEITEKIGQEKLFAVSGNPALPGFTAPKILWVRNHEPENYEKCRKILLPKDWIRYKLTGEFATEVSDASGMLLIDVAKRNWSGEILEKLEIDRALLGECYESYEISGRVTRAAAEQTGLAEGTPVAGGGGDQAAGAVGNGIVRQGLVSATIGTSGVVFAHTDELMIHPSGALQSFCHAVPGAYHVFGCCNASGGSLQWFRNTLCETEMRRAEELGVDPYELMGQAAEKSAVGSGGVLFLPYLLGERTPHLDSDARGVYFGLSGTTDKGDLIRAIMEGVAFSLNDALGLIGEMGITPTGVRISGGGGRSPLWRQICADVFGVSVQTLKTTEGPALGAAILAAVGVGMYDGVPEACDAVIAPDKTQSPIAENAAKYRALYPLYRSLYQALKGEFKTLSQVRKIL